MLWPNRGNRHSTQIWMVENTPQRKGGNIYRLVCGMLLPTRLSRSTRPTFQRIHECRCCCDSNGTIEFHQCHVFGAIGLSQHFPFVSIVCARALPNESIVVCAVQHIKGGQRYNCNRCVCRVGHFRLVRCVKCSSDAIVSNL